MPVVVHIDTSRSWRGGQLQVFLLHRELLHMGVASRLLARSGGALHRRCDEIGLPVEPVNLMRPWYPPAVAAVWRRTRAAEIVHAHDSPAATLAALARAANPHLAVVCHRRIAYPPNGPLTRRWKYRCVDRWIAVSTEIAGVLRRAGAVDVQTVQSAVDVEALTESASESETDALRTELGIGSDLPVVGLVGALVTQKGHETLIAAAPRILSSAPDTVFLCVGDGPLRGRLWSRVRRAGLEHAFRFTGFRRDASTLMNLCTVIAAPSADGEGSSAVIKEAMVLGTPIVASDLPGNVEVLDSEGTTVPAADAEALADAVVKLIENPDRGGETEARRHQRSERWRPGSMAAGVLTAYDNLERQLGLAAETA